MTDKTKANPFPVGVMLAIVFMLACFLGYQIGADVAHKQNGQASVAVEGLQ